MWFQRVLSSTLPDLNVIVDFDWEFHPKKIAGIYILNVRDILPYLENNKTSNI